MIALLLLVACRTSMIPNRDVPAVDPTEDWALTLSLVVTDDGMVDYDALELQRESLDEYVAWIARDEALDGKKTADFHDFYLNAYNALVIYQVLERGRPESVLGVSGLIPKPGSGFFLETQFKVGPDWLSLSEIEHERIRMKELDYRDHAAMNCASRSCPPLMPDIYRKRILQRQLTEQMRRWVNDPVRGVSIGADGVLEVSPIVTWFERDFTFWGPNDTPCGALAEYAEPALRAVLTAANKVGCPRRDKDYDWSLNDASGKAPTAPRERAVIPDDPINLDTDENPG